MANHKALVLGGNYYIGLSIVRCLGKKGVSVTLYDYDESRAFAMHSRYVQEKLIGPDYNKDPEAMLEFLIDYGKQQSEKPVLFPTTDTLALYIDRYMDLLKDYYLITMTEQGLWQKVIDKDQLYRLAERHQMPYPITLSAQDPELLAKLHANLAYPVILKPVDSMGFVSRFRTKLFIIHSDEELMQKIQLTQNAGYEMVVQRFIQGFDDHMYTFDAYLDQNSKVTHWMTGHKLRQFPINFGASTYIRQEYVPRLAELGIPFLQSIGFKGFAEIEFKKDAQTGEFFLIEINARTTNFNAMIEKVGINMPYLAYLELTGHEIGQKVIDYDSHIYFQYLKEDLVAMRDYYRTGQLSLTTMIKSLFNRKVGAIWSWSDPLPGFAYCYQLIAHRFKK